MSDENLRIVAPTHSDAVRVKYATYLSMGAAILLGMELLALMWVVVPVVNLSIERGREVERASVKTEEAANNAKDAAIKADAQAKVTLAAMKQSHSLIADNHKRLIDVAKRIDLLIDKMKVSEEELADLRARH